jgi:hypothetical protein
MEVNKRNSDWKISSMLSAIAVAALWDFFLRDFIYNLGSFFVTSMSVFYQGYFDTLYEGVGSKFDKILYLPGTFMLVLITFVPILLIFSKSIKKPRAYDHEAYRVISRSRFQKFLFEHRNIRLILRSIIMLVLTLQIFDLCLTSLTHTSAILTLERRLEIIRPYITDEESYRLKSEFRLIDNRLKLQTLITKIDDIATLNQVKLPKSRLYGIETRFQ